VNVFRDHKVRIAYVDLQNRGTGNHYNRTYDISGCEEKEELVKS
jgi:hypothetical protein